MPRLTVDRTGSFPRLLLDGCPPALQPYLRSWEKYPGREQVPFSALCDDYRAQYALGCRVFLFHTTAASDFYIPEVETWRGPDEWDWLQLDLFLAFFVSECPDAVLVPTIYLGAPTWWEDSHPDELLRFHDGTCAGEFSAASGSARNKVASLASETWAATMDEGLERVLERLAPYGDRIGGVTLGGGITYEWGLLGSFGFIDYSAPMVRWWDAWRARRGLAPASLPTREDRQRSTGHWREPQHDATASDLQRCLSDLTADRINRFAAITKRSNPELVVGTYYGFTLTARAGEGFIGRYGSGGFQGGHHAFRAVLDCPHIDFITSPWCYANRRLGTGSLDGHFPWDSARLAGKVAWLQDDNRTCAGFPAAGIDTGFESELAGSILQMRRAAARYLCGGEDVYRMDLLGASWADPGLSAAISDLDAAVDKVAHLRAPAAAEVLAIVDEDAVAGLALNSPLHLQNVYHQLAELGRMGCPYHVVLADDAARMDLTPYRLALLLLCPRRDAELSALVARLRGAGLSLVSWPGTGLIADHGIDPAGASAIVGIPLCIPNHAPTSIQGIGPYGATAPLSHRMMPAADPAVVFALAHRDQAFDAFTAVAPLPGRLLAELANRAGCHLWHPGGTLIWASRNLLAIHADAAGSYAITLPSGWTAVRPVLAPRQWAFADGVITCTLDQHDTAVFARS